MRKFTLLWLWLIGTICMAKPITVEKAKAISAKFMAQHVTTTRALSANQLQIKHVFRSETTNAALCYVFTSKDDTGFIIASADDNSEPILAYSDTETFNFKNMAPATRWWLECYQKQIEYASKNERNPKTRAAEARHNIAPLIQTKWNQEAPYNTLCPYDDKEKRRCVTGCVATATAQLMYYHKWPKKGTGSHSYDWNGKKLSADFGNTTFQWDKMKTTYKGNDDTNNAVATLLYNCGIALEMHYGPWGSWAYFRNGEVMAKYFGYSPNYKRVIRNTVGLNAFEEAIYNDLAYGLPVLFGGQDKNKNEGHQFICDGYKSGGYYHMNWGWGGWNDGYFALSALNTEDERQWNWDQEVFCGIKKFEKETTVNGLIFENNGNQTATLKGGKPNNNLIIPENVLINGQQCKVTSIANAAFKNNTKITDVTIPSSINSVGAEAFLGCTHLINLTIKDNKTELTCGKDLFKNTSLRNAHIGRTLMGNGVFGGISTLTNVSLSNNVKTLTPLMFYMTGLKTIDIPNSVDKIDGDAFNKANSLEKITVQNGNTKYASDGGALYDKAKKTLILLPHNSKITDFRIPETVVTIKRQAITSGYIKSLVIPSRIQTIETDAILCTKIERIYINNAVPPTVNEHGFTAPQFVITNTKLCVPGGKLNLYKKTKGWSRFQKIIETTYTDIQPAVIDNNIPNKIYTIDGKRVPTNVNSLKELQPGIYIINGHKIIIQ